MVFRVPFIRPVFPSPAEISADFQEIAAANWFTNFGPKERQFAAAIGARFGEPYQAVTFSNATLAIMGALLVLLGRGDGSRGVLVPSFTFAAGPQAIQWCGYRPVFLDIDPGTLQPSADDARERLERDPAVAAILLCNTFGIGSAQVGEWEALAAEYDLPLVIDSAAGFGSRYADDRPVGVAGTCEVFSFHATKPMAVGEGGAVLTRDPELAVRLSEFTNFGFSAASGAVAPGLNGKLQEINAAIGLRQLERIDALVRARQTALAGYRERLGDDRFGWPEGIERSSVCFATVLLPDRATRDRARDALVAGGVEARTYYSPPVHRQPHFAADAAELDLPGTEDAGHRVLSVPVYADMSEEDRALVLDLLDPEGGG